ncbi:hypothetical protein GTY65_24325 [Streptomyces sp. SID8379]|uniref:DUF6415 family natural product biosynthesis protein n=1 Tax=unclassified Streptomyces TaxID=2593676 RepID=UPI000370380B|nr:MULTISPECIES: hypothetical protein [unclassified Streptomyces]MYW67170.1 hypothetical protein [Streptomyces sp. SID8379]
MTTATAARPTREPLPQREGELHRIINALARSLAEDGLSDSVYDALNDVLDAAENFAPEQLQQIGNRFRSAARQLVHTAPYRTTVYPTAQIARLKLLHEERPDPDGALSYARRFAVAISALLDEMGDD